MRSVRGGRVRRRTGPRGRRPGPARARRRAAGIAIGDLDLDRPRGPALRAARQDRLAPGRGGRQAAHRRHAAHGCGGRGAGRPALDGGHARAGDDVHGPRGRRAVDRARAGSSRVLGRGARHRQDPGGRGRGARRRAAGAAPHHRDDERERPGRRLPRARRGPHGRAEGGPGHRRDGRPRAAAGLAACRPRPRSSARPRTRCTCAPAGPWSCAGPPRARLITSSCSA